MAGGFAGRVAVVTGAGRGLGRCHALALAAAGARVVVNDVAREGPYTAEKVVAEIRAAGGEAVASTASVADWDQAGQIIDAAIRSFGRLDILVNNAGVSPYDFKADRFVSLASANQRDWDGTIAVNLTGTAATMHWAARHWQAIGRAAGRAIINTSSPAGTNPVTASFAYCASKAGVLGLTIRGAEELAELGVRVNCIAPIARTPLTETRTAFAEVMKKPADGFDQIAAENISPVVLWLASPSCRFTARVFGAYGDDLYLFDGFSANHHFSNSGKRWTIDALDEATRDIAVQDLGKAISPWGGRVQPNPSNGTLETLALAE